MPQQAVVVADQPAQAVGRRVAAHPEMEMPEVPFPSARVLEIAGADGLRRLVRHHHGLLRHSPIGHLFAADEAEFTALVERIADYVVEVCGGPALFTPLHGNTCLRTRHFPFTIDERGREIWLEKLLQAIDETGFPPELHEEYWAWMEPFTIRMINRRTTKAQPIRLPYALARQRFATPVQA
ncbi:MAG: globin [Rhodocyclales bacterium GT-UBC]|nr:MAG: globin [Rhodocyclales bacterium GT-UBC]